jgi:lipoate-protein ligase A
VIGGGAVYLNKDQVFYQYIFNENSPILPKTFADFYKIFLDPVVKTYNDFKVPAIYRPVNDIEADGKKVSGTGAGTFENSRILTGNFLMDFDYKTMTKVLKVPDEKFRDKIYKSLTERLSTFKNIIGSITKIKDVVEKYKKNLEKSLDIKLIEESLSEREKNTLKSLYKKYRDPKWVNLFEEERSELLNRSIKIAKDTGIAKAMYKAPGGLIKILIEVEQLKIKDILINGDFFIYPEDSLRELEHILRDSPYQIEEILRKIENFYEKNEIESPGVKPKDFIKALKNCNLDLVVG